MTDKQTGQSRKITDSIKRNYLLILNAVGMAFILIVVIWAVMYPDMTYVYTLMIYAGLFVITTIYAAATWIMARGTKEQAKASAEMVEEMRAQRLAARPFVVPDIDEYRFQQAPYIKPETGGAYVAFPVIITNVGASAAVELELSLKLPEQISTTKYDHLTNKLPFLLKDATWKGELFYILSNMDDVQSDIDFLQSLENTHPPDGLYELTVTFRSPTDSQPSDIILPFKLSWMRERIQWTMRLERHKPILHLAAAEQLLGVY